MGCNIISGDGELITPDGKIMIRIIPDGFCTKRYIREQIGLLTDSMLYNYIIDDDN